MIDRVMSGLDEKGMEAAAALERVVRERDNLQARLTARAKSMLRLREALAGVHDNIEDEGDRTYFGSTNDADTFREVWQDLDAWAWDDIMSDGKITDVYAASREAHTRAEVAEAKLAEARKVIEPFVAASEAHKAAVERYNARLIVVKEERARDDWSGRMDAYDEAVDDARRAMYAEMETLRSSASRFLEETK